MNETISVVIPAYNVGQYIGKCLDSVLAQTYRSLEIIVVNDGATDDTPDIIKTYLTDPRIRYIEQKNAGVSAARNAGIAASSGKYLAFVDSDDYLEPEMYARLHRAISDNNADFAVCDYNLVYDDHTEDCYSSMEDGVIDLVADVSAYFFRYCACPKPNNYIWTRLYRAEIIKKAGISFGNYRLGDDTLFNFMLLPHLSRAAYLSGGFYNYFQRANSNVYTVARRSNLAGVYAATFAALVAYYESIGFKPDFLPIHAYTRLRSVVFYSRLAGMADGEITAMMKEGLDGELLPEYLCDSSAVDRYVRENGFTAAHALRMKEIMRAAGAGLTELVDAVLTEGID